MIILIRKVYPENKKKEEILHVWRSMINIQSYWIVQWLDAREILLNKFCKSWKVQWWKA